MFSTENQLVAEELVNTIRFFNQKGWSPATSTNYSVRSQINKDEYIISRSGVDKSQFSISDLILINPEGEILPPFNQPGLKSSAETEIHTTLYRIFPQTNCILHTHSVLGTVLSHTFANEKCIKFDGLEILKGLDGNKTHELTTTIPIVPNSQDMKVIIKNMEGRYGGVHGFLIAGHGLYTWGKDIATAKRHIETFEFLFECYHAMRRF